MKYIRTKDGIIKYGEHKLGVKFTDNYIKERVSDTIEELCDEFVEVWKSEDILCHKNIPIYNKRAMNEYNKYRKETSIIYGAIWTDEGLKYVAKMNDKGELDLL